MHVPLAKIIGGSSIAAGLLVSTVTFPTREPAVLAPPPPLAPAFVPPATGPLRVNPANGRYFVDPAGRTVYLTGAHTWDSLQDLGPENPPDAFDYDRYLDFLQAHQLNFVRLWRWDTCEWTDPATQKRFFAPSQPWERTGPGLAADGLPKFDLTRFNERYFSRLRARVEAARDRGIYVSIMLFEGWTVRFTADAWRGHPFYPANNVNALDPALAAAGAGVRIYTLQLPAVVRLQERYVRKLVDTVADLDNVLFEVANEAHSGSHPWQEHLVRFIRTCEAGRPQRHPIGLTSTGGIGVDDTAQLFASDADWISPNAQRDDYKHNPPAASGEKVVIVDTDHLWGLGGTPAWVWKSFLRGLNPILMDPYESSIAESPLSNRRLEELRRALGATQRLAAQLDLAAMPPRPDLATSSYCLAHPGSEYLVYLPAEDGREVTVDLSGIARTFTVEWLDPASGRAQPAGEITGGRAQPFVAPFSHGSLLHLFVPAPAVARETLTAFAVSP